MDCEQQAAKLTKGTYKYISSKIGTYSFIVSVGRSNQLMFAHALYAREQFIPKNGSSTSLLDWKLIAPLAS